jgi:hypothetical protein
LFEDVTEPQAGDIVCWDAHMGIVYNTERKEFIHAPHTGDHVRIAEYGSGYWGGTSQDVPPLEESAIATAARFARAIGQDAGAARYHWLSNASRTAARRSP